MVRRDWVNICGCIVEQRNSQLIIFTSKGKDLTFDIENTKKKEMVMEKSRFLNHIALERLGWFIPW